ncbi:sensor histidine kinase [Thalassobacillus pellis]|uniref:sensor histidine kinase n=1 Tax=Thalassobacillus pellis TaxID=748008 RepID=UPI0019604D05|nr:HAMP domain-containing sensor histidine kinase [Thalassobacillus pellis]MBM7553356.1 histidine kinase [Thalassobacillus pellis]
MSIRKRLFMSNAAMILLPIIIIIFILVLLHIVLGGRESFQDSGNQWMHRASENIELYDSLVKTASLEQGKLDDKQYINKLTEQADSENLKIIINKGKQILYASDSLTTLSHKDLKDIKDNSTYTWLGKTPYTIRHHDFYFADGTKGAIYLLSRSESFPTFARTFFPVIILSLVIILVLTNGILSYLVSKSILRPVNQLSEASFKMKNGDYNFSIHSSRNDELGRLVRTFDAMRSQVKESIELREKYESNRKELIANISHDLKTPITSIMGYVEGIQVGVANTEDKRRRYLEIIYTKAAYMNRLIEELSLYSTLDLKKLPFNFEIVNMNEFVQDYIDEIKDDLHEKGILVTFSTEETELMVTLDRDKLARSIENIIYNSVKYMEQKHGRIAVSLINREKEVEISITDNGPGVPSSELSHIFNQFYQAEQARHQGGSGLGLAIAAQIIQAHGGSMWAENAEGAGLSVHFILKKSVNEGESYE